MYGLGVKNMFVLFLFDVPNLFFWKQTEGTFIPTTQFDTNSFNTITKIKMSLSRTIDAVPRDIQTESGIRDWNKFIHKLVPDEMIDPRDPKLPAEGFHTRLLTRLMAGWDISKCIIQGIDQLPALIYPHMIDNALKVVYRHLRTNRWYRFRLANARVGRPLHHDSITGVTTISSPATSHEAGRKYGAMLYADLVWEVLKQSYVKDHAITFKSITHGQTIRYLDRLPAMHWDIVEIRQRVELFEQQQMIGSECDNGRMGFDSQSPFRGLYSFRGHLKAMPPARKVAENIPVSVITKSEEKKLYSHVLTVRSQHEYKSYHSTSTMMFKCARENQRQPRLTHQIVCVINHMADMEVPVTVLFLMFGWPLDAIRLAVQAAAGPDWYPEFESRCEHIIRVCPCEPTQRGAVLFLMKAFKAAKAKAGGPSYAQGSNLFFASDDQTPLPSLASSATSSSASAPSLSSTASTTTTTTGTYHSYGKRSDGESRSRAGMIRFDASDAKMARQKRWFDFYIPPENPDDVRRSIDHAFRKRGSGNRVVPPEPLFSRFAANAPTDASDTFVSCVSVGVTTSTTPNTSTNNNTTPTPVIRDDDSPDEARIRYMQYALANGILPHLGNADFASLKCLCLGDAIWQLWMSNYKELPQDDRDSSRFCRWTTARDNIANNARQLVATSMKTSKRHVLKAVEADNKVCLNNSTTSTTPSAITITTKHEVKTKVETKLQAENDIDVGNVDMEKYDSAIGTDPGTEANQQHTSYIDIMLKFMKSSKPTAQVDRCWKSNSWGASKTRKAREGVLHRITPANLFAKDAAVSMMTSTLGRQSKQADSRGVRIDHQYLLDMGHTPEGPKCGWDLHRAYSIVTLGTSPRAFIRELLRWSHYIQIIPVCNWWDYCIAAVEDSRRSIEHANVSLAHPTAAPVVSTSTAVPNTPITSVTNHATARVISVSQTIDIIAKNTTTTRTTRHTSTGTPTVAQRKYNAPKFTNQQAASIQLNKSYFHDKVKVRVSGVMFGWIFRHEVHKLIALVRHLKRAGSSGDHFVSPAFRPTHHVVDIFTEAGRSMFPAIVYEHYDRLSKCSLNHVDIEYLVRHGVVEFLDASEMCDTMHTRVASGPDDIKLLLKSGITPTHVLIHPMMEHDSVLNQMPYWDHNMYPRHTYQGSMVKTAYKSSWNDIFDFLNHCSRLLWSQQPIVTTTAVSVRPVRDRTYGIHMRFLVMPFEGLNIEDPYVFVEGFVDRGGLCTTSTNTVRYFQKRTSSNTSREFIQRPDPKITQPMKDANYTKIHMRGVPVVGENILPGDPIIGITSSVQSKRMTIQEGGHPERRRDVGRISRFEPKWCQRAELRTNTDGLQNAKVVLVSQRKPQIGNKFSSRHGQKGVISNILRCTDTPYEVNTGWIPNVIVNPHGFPTRHTTGQQRSLLHALARAYAPDRVSHLANPFEKREELDRLITSVLLQYGLNPLGTVRMRHQHTGKIIECPIATGIEYIEALPHIASDKANARGEGPITVRTKQPVEGKNQGGGLRFGPMENSALEAYSATYTKFEKTTLMSDKTKSYWCQFCGVPTPVNLKEKKFNCEVCGRSDGVVVAITAYSGSNLLPAEQLPLGLLPRMLLERTGQYMTADRRIGTEQT